MVNLPIAGDSRAKIAAAIAAVEARTHARFALVIVPASDAYLFYPVVWGFAAAVFLTGLAAVFRPDLGIGIGVALNAALTVALALIFDLPVLRFRLVPRRVKHAHARALARREFAARVIGAREQRPCLLFFVSLGERYVEVLADRELHERVGAATWERLVADFTARARAGDIVPGFIAAVETCGSILETHAPRQDPA